MHHVDVSCLSCILQAGILAVGRGNKVVEPVVGSDGKMIYGYYIWVLYSAIIFWCIKSRQYKNEFNFFPLGVERPAVVTKMNLTISADHRVFDGNVGGTYARNF